MHHAAGFPQACSFNHSPPCSSYSCLVTRAAFASSDRLHSAIPFQASKRGLPPSRLVTILSGARNGKTGVSVFRSRGMRLGMRDEPPVTKMHYIVSSGTLRPRQQSQG